MTLSMAPVTHSTVTPTTLENIRTTKVQRSRDWSVFYLHCENYVQVLRHIADNELDTRL